MYPILIIGFRVLVLTRRATASISQDGAIRPLTLCFRQQFKTSISTNVPSFISKRKKIFKQEQPFTPIAYLTDYQVINKHLTGFKINPLGPTICSRFGLK